MEPISLLSAVSAAIVAAVGTDKFRSFYKLLKNKKRYESALYIRKYVIKNWTKHLDLDKHSDIIKRIIISDKDIASEESIKKAYSHLLGEYKHITIDMLEKKIEKYHLLSKYFESTIRSSDKSFIKFDVALNSGLISSLLQNLLSATDRSALDRSTIVGMLVGNKIKQDTKSYVYLLIALLIHLGMSLFSVMDINPYLISGLIFLIGGLSVNQKITEYRIRKGHYGSTPYETREIIRYIEEHADKNNFTDGDGKKKLFQDMKSSIKKEELVYGGAYQ